MINAGVFALEADAPHWRAGPICMGEALQRSTDMTDQVALNVLVYDQGFGCEPLPSRCNWPIHHATPAWDAERGLFVEPAMPYDPLGHPAHDHLHQAAGDPGRARAGRARMPARSGRARCAGPGRTAI